MAIVIHPDIRNFHKVFEPLCRVHDAADVFDAFLGWIVAGWCADGTIAWTDGERFSAEEQKQFNVLFDEYVKALHGKIASDEHFYDLFGTYYEQFVGSASKRGMNGQFFTPEHMCSVMAQLNSPDGNVGKGMSVSDPCCGSGRLLLAFHANKGWGNYLCGEDLDRTCCLMTVCNFMMHGVVGEVVWHDSLAPDSWHYGWRVNANLNNPLHEHYGIPHVETLSKEDSVVWRHWQRRKENIDTQQPLPVVQVVELPKKVEQLKLF